MLKSTMVSFIFDTQNEVADLTLVHQMFHLTSVSLVMVVIDEAHYYCVICKLYDVVSSTAVVAHQLKEQRTQNAAQEGTGAQEMIIFPLTSCGW